MITPLTFEIQKTIKEISLNNKKRFEQISKEVCEFEIKNLLGIQMFQAISNDDDDLFRGCEFEINGKTIYHNGLNYVHAFLNYASYIGEANVFDTFSGLVQKNNGDSTQITAGQIKNLQTRNRDIAFESFELTKMYILANKEKYPYFCKNKEEKRYSNRFSGITKTIEYDRFHKRNRF